MREKQKPPGNGKKQDVSQEKKVRIEHIFPDGQQSLFSNHITVQHTNEGEFTISFFEACQPILMGQSSDVEKQFDDIKSVPANCVAKIVVAAARMPGLIGALINNYETYERDTGKSPDEATEQPNSRKNAS